MSSSCASNLVVFQHMVQILRSLFEDPLDPGTIILNGDEFYWCLGNFSVRFDWYSIAVERLS